MEYANNPQEESVPEQTPRDKDIELMLAAKTHLGTMNLEEKMKHYVYKRNEQGHYIINVAKTYEKLQLAARILVTIENPADIVAVSARPFGSRAVLKFAHYTGAQSMAGRWTPGTFTNQITKKFMEPRILVVSDPYTDQQAVKECFYANIPVIAFCNTDTPLNYVDVVIPCNNKSAHSIALMYWMLAREILCLRKQIPRSEPWSVMPDLFFYKEVDETPAIPKEAEEVAATRNENEWGAPQTAAPAATWDNEVALDADKWGGAQAPAAQEWGGQ